MLFTISSLLVDFGLTVLIWTVQLIIYPSFSYYPIKNLVTWHRKYTKLIGYLVGPLMLVQLAFALYRITSTITFFSIGSLLIVFLIWVITFLQFIPRHRNISRGRINEQLLSDLVRKNWSRTVLWTLLFLWGVIDYVF